MERLLSPTGGIEVPAGRSDGPHTFLALVREHGLVVVRDLHLGRDDYAELIALLGRPVPPPFLTEIITGSGVAVLESEISPEQFDDDQVVVFASGWHSDWTFLERPPTVSSLYCEAAPQAGGDTLFCDTAAGTARLSPALRGFLSGLTAKHRSDRSFSDQGAYGQRTTVGAHRTASSVSYTATHPVIAASPLGGAECALISPAYVSRINELRSDESGALLQMMQDLLLWHEYTIRLSWRPGTLLLWDNYRFVHRALNQGTIGLRRLLRSNIMAA